MVAGHHVVGVCALEIVDAGVDAVRGGAEGVVADGLVEAGAVQVPLVGAEAVVHGVALLVAEHQTAVQRAGGVELVGGVGEHGGAALVEQDLPAGILNLAVSEEIRTKAVNLVEGVRKQLAVFGSACVVGGGYGQGHAGDHEQGPGADQHDQLGKYQLFKFRLKCSHGSFSPPCARSQCWNSGSKCPVCAFSRSPYPPPACRCGPGEPGRPRTGRPCARSGS